MNCELNDLRAVRLYWIRARVRTVLSGYRTVRFVGSLWDLAVLEEQRNGR